MTDANDLQLSSLIQMDDGASDIDFAPSLGGLKGVKAAILNSDLMKKTILNGLSQALNIDVGTCLGAAWSSLDGVRDALKATRDDPSAKASIPLAPHQLKSTHKPTVTLIIDGFPPLDLAFDVDFTLKIDSLEMEIAEGRIKAIKSGGLSSHAIVKVGGQALFEKASQRFDLPGRLHFPKNPAEPAPSASPPPGEANGEQQSPAHAVAKSKEKHLAGHASVRLSKTT